MRLKDKIRTIPYLAALKTLAKKKHVDVYLVGGFLRDSYLAPRGALNDFDVIVSRNAALFARAFARKLKAKLIILDEDEQTYRVILKKGKEIYHYDFAGLRGPDLIADLRLRDFPINSMCLNVNRYPHSTLYDPLGGEADIGRKIVRVADEGVLCQDPLRILRAFSIALRCGFRIEKRTLGFLRKHRALLRKVSAERINEELFKILACDDCYATIRRMTELEIIDEIIPSFAACRGVTQEGGFHHLDVLNHSLETLLRFEMMYRNKLIRRREVADYLNQELAAQRTRKQIIKLACILHDIGKPRAKKRKNKKTIFHQHEKFGARMACDIGDKLKLSFREKESLKKLIFWHLRPGYLADIRLPSARAVYRFFRDAACDGVGIILLSLADWRATRGPRTSRGEKIKHEKVMLALLDEYFEGKKKKPLPRLLNGFDIMKKFHLEPSPLVGDILRAVHEEQALGKCTAKKDAYVLARKIMDKKRKKG